MIIGHKNQREIIEKIFDSYKNGSFLLVGPEGVGKFSLMKEISENKTSKDNLIIVKSENKFILKGTADLMRNFALLNSLKSRIIIVNDAHLFNDESQNLLLKTFEEIPSNTFFFLITHRPNKILATIKSRLYPIKFGFVESEEIKKMLKERGIEKYAKAICDMFSGQPGLIIKAISERAKFNLVSRFIEEKDKLEKMLLTEKISEQMELDEFLKYLLFFERANLKNNTKDALARIKNLLALYFDNEYAAPPLHKNMHIKNVCVNYY